MRALQAECRQTSAWQSCRGGAILQVLPCPEGCRCTHSMQTRQQGLQQRQRPEGSHLSQVQRMAQTSAMAPLTEWLAAAMSGDTYAPMDRMAEEVPPGAPTVDSAGPAHACMLTPLTRAAALLTVAQ